MKICSVEGCGKPVHCKGMCKSHYQGEWAKRTTRRKCETEGCDKPHNANGLCSTCNARHKRNRIDGQKCKTKECTRNAVAKGFCGACRKKEIKKSPGRARCSVGDCHNPEHVNGFCSSHDARNKKYGDPLGGGCYRGQTTDFIEMVSKSQEKEYCIIWPFAKTNHGYGQINVGKRKRRLVNHIILEKTIGEAPIGKPLALHNCAKGHLGCCNPNHMYWGDKKDNGADMVDHGTSLKGERHSQARLTVTDVHYMRRMYREGRASQAELARKFGVATETARCAIIGKSWSWLD